jgi:hypothetical protein
VDPPETSSGNGGINAALFRATITRTPASMERMPPITTSNVTRPGRRTGADM